MTNLLPKEERPDCPTGSGLEDYFLCHKKYLGQKNMPPSKSSEASIFGDNVHGGLSGEIDKSKLPADVLVMIKKMLAIRKEAAEAWKKLAVELNSTYDSNLSKTQTFLERRFFLEKNGKKIFSSKVDVFYLIPYSDPFGYEVFDLFIIDYKTGKIPVSHASINKQLWAAAALIYHTYKNKIQIQNIGAAIIQPEANPKYTLACYHPDDVLNFRGEIEDLIPKITDPGAAATPGYDQCYFCTFKTRCQACHQWAGTFTDEDGKLLSFSLILPKLQILSLLIEGFKEEAISFVQKGEKIDGYALAFTSPKRLISDSLKAFHLLKGDINEEEFIKHSSPNLGELGKLLTQKRKVTQDKGKAILNETLKEVMDFTKRSEYLIKL